MTMPPSSLLFAILRRIPGYRRLVLRQADRLTASVEADILLSRWVARDPDHLALRWRHALEAHHRGLYAEALERWNAIRARWPDEAFAWSGSASNLRELGRVHEARVVITEALRRFPEDLITISEALRIDNRLGDATSVLALSAEMMRLEPGRPQWRKAHFDRLLEARHLAEAAALVDDTEPDDPHFAICKPLLVLRHGNKAAADAMLRAFLDTTDRGRFAQLLEAAIERKLRHPAEACLLLTHLVHIAPDDPGSLHHLAEALIRAGRYDDARTTIERALRYVPDDDDLHHDRAHLAFKTSRWQDAIAGFEDQLRRRPNHAEARVLLAEARMERELAHLDADGGASPEPPADEAAAQRQDVGLVEDEEIRQLLLGFESVGQDCEFGLVKRRYGAEPLGLFRWNFTRALTLTEASNAGFEGMGDPEQTTMALWDDYEYNLKDRRWGFAFHTCRSRHEVEYDALYATMCKRIVFLRRKLLSDLASGEKILVHKSFDTQVDAVRALAASLRRHGPVRLLWVRALSMLPDEGARRHVGQVEEIEPGVYASYVSVYGNRLHAPWHIVFEDWVAVCRATAALAAKTPVKVTT